MNQLLKEWEEEQAIKAEMQDIVSQHNKLYPPKIPQDLTSPIFNKVGPGPKTIGPGIPLGIPRAEPGRGNILPFERTEEGVKWAMPQAMIEFIEGIKAPRDVMEGRKTPEQGALETAMAVAGMGYPAGMVIPGPSGFSLSAVKGYHGSPYKFEKFMNEKIGSGEGAQAFGYGHYFAGRKEVAEHYKNKLSRMNKQIKIEGSPLKKHKEIDELLRGGSDFESAYTWIGIDVVDHIDEALYRANSVNDALGFLEEKIIHNEMLSEADDIIEQIQALEAAKDFILRHKDKITMEKQKGQLYKVELTPDDDEFLLWDKPLSEQSDKVKQALKVIGIKDTGTYLGEFAGKPIHGVEATGQEIYRRLASKLSEEKLMFGGQKISNEEKASRTLLSKGIKGIKYLEGASRKKGEGEYNYVIFDPEHINIEGIE